MMKRISLLLLCVALLLAALPIHASAASSEEKERICQQIRDTYWKSLSYAGMSSFKGYCGEMAGWELYHLGLTDAPMTQNGNQMYDIMVIGDHISEGIEPAYYPSSAYTLEEALNTITNCGERDAYDIMVGFSWTSTAAGRLYGHVNVIHAILDGQVYFTEGFTTPFQDNPSEPMICSIPEFAAYYEEWTVFEGLVHFVKESDINGCTTYGSDMFATANGPITLMTSPYAEEAQEGRTVSMGERLYITALCENSLQERYYRITEDDVDYFLPVDAVSPFLFLYDDMKIDNIVLPEQLAEKADFKLSGTIHSKRCQIVNAVVQITDANGEAVVTQEIPKNSNMVDLSARSVNSRLNFGNLPAGNYTCDVFCDMTNYYDEAGLLIGDMQRVWIAGSEFTVGDAEPVEKDTAASVTKAVKNGWQYENEQWYYYENNQAKTGWLCDNGINYYLQEDGTAATGWKNINGKNRCFTQTGAMLTGWLETQDGTYYLLRNGIPVTGWFEVDGQLRFFTEGGVLVVDAVRNFEGQAYQIDSEGVATLIQ